VKTKSLILSTLILFVSGSSAWAGSSRVLEANTIRGLPTVNISNSGSTLTLPTSVDTLVGRATTDTLTNKTLTSPTINNGTASGVTITGGSIDNTPIGATTQSTAKFTSVGVTGTGGVGYYGIVAQSANPSTPGSGFNLFANSSHYPAWKLQSGFVLTFDVSALSADRSYVYPNASTTLVGTDVTQTLTNKTLSGNTASNFVNGAATITLPSATGTLVTLAGTEQLTNKDIDGGTASNAKRITLPKDTLSNLNSLTRKAGTLVYSTDQSAVYYDDGSTLNAIAGGTAYSAANLISNLALATSVSSSAMTVALKTQAGSDPASSDKVQISFRNSTAATGTYTTRNVTGSLSITINSGATLGHVSAKDQYIWVYALDNSGTVELAVSGTRMWDEGSLQSTTAMSGSATGARVLYSTTARSNVPIRLIGRLKSNQTTAGTWAAVAAEITANPSYRDATERSEIRLRTTSGYGSSATSILIWGTVVKNTGTAITYTTSSVNGDTFTINEDGIYSVGFGVNLHVAASYGITLNTTQTSTNVITLTNPDERLAVGIAAGADRVATISWTGALKTGDVLRAHTDATAIEGDGTRSVFYIVKIRD
jgi:hypothetical protein